jgi:hypothetical protein
MTVKRQRDFCCGLLFVGVGLAFAWFAGTWPLGHWSAPGPGFFGLCLALVLTMVGGGMLFVATTFESPGGDPIGPLGTRTLALLLLAVIAFGLALPRLGLIATVLLVVLIASLAAPEAGGYRLRASPTGRRLRWRGVLLNALVSGVAAWVLCHLLLKLSLPLWPLPLAAWAR